MKMTGLGLVCVWIAAAAVTAQRPVKDAVPRTAWGDPDLSGTWTTTAMSGVPIERPVQFGTRSALTDDELAALASRLKQQAEIDAADFVHDAGAAAPTAGQEFRDRLEGRVATVNPIGPDPVWVELGSASRQTSLLIDPPDGRYPPLTPDGQRRASELAARRAAARLISDRTLYTRCISRGVVGSALPMITDSGNDITQAPGYVVIRHEMIHEARVIPLDGRPHVNPAIRSYMGDSRGWWEGNTLVIDTGNFRPEMGVDFNGGGGPSLSREARVRERLTRVSADRLDYQLTVDDPLTWTRPWTVAFPWQRNEAHTLFEFACHEGNRAMRNMLSAELAADRPGR